MYRCFSLHNYYVTLIVDNQSPYTISQSRVIHEQTQFVWFFPNRIRLPIHNGTYLVCAKRERVHARWAHWYLAGVIHVWMDPSIFPQLFATSIDDNCVGQLNSFELVRLRVGTIPIYPVRLVWPSHNPNGLCFADILITQLSRISIQIAVFFCFFPLAWFIVDYWVTTILYPWTTAAKCSFDKLQVSFGWQFLCVMSWLNGVCVPKPKWQRATPLKHVYTAQRSIVNWIFWSPLAWNKPQRFHARRIAAYSGVRRWSGHRRAQSAVENVEERKSENGLSFWIGYIGHNHAHARGGRVPFACPARVDTFNSKRMNEWTQRNGPATKQTGMDEWPFGFRSVCAVVSIRFGWTGWVHC